MFSSKAPKVLEAGISECDVLFSIANVGIIEVLLNNSLLSIRLLCMCEVKERVTEVWCQTSTRNRIFFCGKKERIVEVELFSAEFCPLIVVVFLNETELE